MPHQCTNCERVFPDGSKEMLSGCPDCGGNKFQFKPDSTTPPPTLGDDDASESTPSSDTPSESTPSSDTPSESTPSSDTPSESTPSSDTTSAGTPSSDTTSTGTAPSPTVDSTPSEPSSSPDSTPAPPSDRPADASAGTSSSASTTDADYIEAESDPSVLEEDTAQADARRDVVTRDELDEVASSPPSADDAARTIPPDSSTADESPDIEDLRAELNDQFESIKILEPGQYELNLMELYDRQECIISLQEDGHYVIEVVDTWRDGDS